MRPRIPVLMALLTLLAALSLLSHETTADQGSATQPATQTAAEKADLLAKGGTLAALERKLLGMWDGPPCDGDFTFNADGTFTWRNFTPGGNTLTGVWSLRWDALPPTLVLTCKTSDFRTKDPTREEYEHLGKAQDLKVLELNPNALVVRFPKAWDWRGERRRKP